MAADTELFVDSPYSLETVVKRTFAAPAEVDRVLDRARAAARAARATRIGERASLCLRAVEAMERARDAIARDITTMMGKPIRQAVREVAVMAARARHMISIAEYSMHETHL